MRALVALAALTAAACTSNNSGGGSSDTSRQPLAELPVACDRVSRTAGGLLQCDGVFYRGTQKIRSVDGDLLVAGGRVWALTAAAIQLYEESGDTLPRKAEGTFQSPDNNEFLLDATDTDLYTYRFSSEAIGLYRYRLASTSFIGWTLDPYKTGEGTREHGGTAVTGTLLFAIDSGKTDELHLCPIATLEGDGLHPPDTCPTRTGTLAGADEAVFVYDSGTRALTALKPSGGTLAEAGTQTVAADAGPLTPLGERRSLPVFTQTNGAWTVGYLRNGALRLERFTPDSGFQWAGAAQGLIWEKGSGKTRVYALNP